VNRAKSRRVLEIMQAPSIRAAIVQSKRRKRSISMPTALDAVDSKRDPDSRRRTRFTRAALAIALFALGSARRRGGRSVRLVARTTRRRFDQHTPANTLRSVPLGWKETARRTLADFSRHRVMAEAAAVTFYSVLALFPAIAALVSLYGLFADPAFIGAQLGSMSAVLPGGAIQVIGDQMTRVADQGHGKLGLGLAIGLIVALWSANSGTKSLFDALNTVYGVNEERGFVKLNAISLTMTVGGIVFMIIAAGALIVLPTALGFAGVSGVIDWAVCILRWPALFLVVAVGLAVIYRYGPDRREAQWRWITAGSASATLGWLIVSFAFSWYAANFGSYNATYGSLGAIIGFMIWIWLSTTVVLAGAEIDVTLETGRTRPLRASHR
jgi:membrane protein